MMLNGAKKATAKWVSDQVELSRATYRKMLTVKGNYYKKQLLQQQSTVQYCG